MSILDHTIYLDNKTIFAAMECHRCFSIGPHVCPVPMDTPSKYHCGECGGLKNPVLSDWTCLWCRSQLRNTPRSDSHLQRCPAKPVNMTAYRQHQCDCPRLEAVRKQLKEVVATRTSDRIMVPCSQMDWLWFVQYGGMSEAELKKRVVTFWPN